jgi:hypothetical protein
VIAPEGHSSCIFRTRTCKEDIKTKKCTNDEGIGLPGQRRSTAIVK